MTISESAAALGAAERGRKRIKDWHQYLETYGIK